MGGLLAALKAIAAIFGFGEKVVAEVHDSNQRQAGRDSQVVADQGAVIGSLKRQQEAAAEAPKTTEATVANLRKGGF